MKILLAEDEPVSRYMLQELLTKWGFDVIAVADGREALAAFEAEDAPRLAILDWVMPGVEGVEVCRRLKAMDRGPFTYVIMLTVRGKTEDIVQALDVGADTYLTKPIDSLELRSRIGAGERILGLQDQLTEANARLLALARVDTLTQVANRLAIMENLTLELNRASRQRYPMAVAMLDIDNFKRINDTYGHPVGDQALVEVAHRLRVLSRNYDLVGRYGGEEFLFGVLGATPDETRHVVDRILHGMRTASIRVDDARSFALTASVGVCCISAGRECGIETAIHLADNALYKAKRDGRDRAEIVSFE